MKLKISILVPLLILLSACTINPDGSQSISQEGQIALETSVRIAVRHAVADSPRGAEKARNIREVVARLQTVLTAESTLAALQSQVSGEIDKLGLSTVDNADAKDLLALFGAALEARLGSDALQSEGLVRVSAFLDLVLAALPA